MSEHEGSVRPLSMKHYPPGYGEDDDLNHDGIIDPIEQTIKVHKLQNAITMKINDKVTENYVKKFRKEVDFHHKVAYRFEKAYRLGKNNGLIKQQYNHEINALISEHHEYIEQDPMVMFYCLFFCIYYNNEDIIGFLRCLISKVEHENNKIDMLLKFID